MRFSRNWAELVLKLLDYTPNQQQYEIVDALLSGTRFLLLCGGERSGKSFTTSALALLLSQPSDMTTISNSEPTLGWIIGPDYKQARAEFDYIRSALSRVGVVVQESVPNNPTSPWSMKTDWNLTVETKTSNDITKLASYAPNWVVMAEAAQQMYDVWLKARGRVAETRGHVLLSGTLENGLPWYGDLLKRWKGENGDGGRSFSLPTWSNTAIFPGGWDDPEIVSLRNSLPEDYFFERYGAEPRKATNLVIPDFEYPVHVQDLEPMADVPVELWIDPGKNCYAVLFVQVIGQTTYILDRVYRRGVIAQDVIPECMANPLWELVKKNERSHGVIDIAGRQHHGMPSHIEIWKEDAGVVLRSNYVHQDTGRDVVRYRLSHSEQRDPLVYFNSHITNAKSPDGSANDVFAEFELWKWREPGPYSNEPPRPIDANNHAIKALGYGLYDKFGPVYERAKRPPRMRRKYWETM